MRELIYYVAVSLDGFIADPDGGFDAFLVDGDHAPVVFAEYADALPGHVHAALGTKPPGTTFDSVIMGWKTLAPALSAGIDSPYPHLQQFVASHQAREVAPAVTLTSDPLATVRELKQRDGLDIWLCGGGELAGTLMPEIDRLVLKRNPLVFGSGVPLFARGGYEPRAFALEAARSFQSGVIVEEYARMDSSQPSQHVGVQPLR